MEGIRSVIRNYFNWAQQLLPKRIDLKIILKIFSFATALGATYFGISYLRGRVSKINDTSDLKKRSSSTDASDTKETTLVNNPNPGKTEEKSSSTDASDTEETTLVNNPNPGKTEEKSSTTNASDAEETTLVNNPGKTEEKGSSTNASDAEETTLVNNPGKTEKSKEEESLSSKTEESEKIKQSLATSLKKIDAVGIEKICNQFSKIDSSQLVDIPQEIKGRKDFQNLIERDEWSVSPAVISTSDFVPPLMVEHLMRNKKDTALGSKYDPEKGDKITNMEGAFQTFVTPIAGPITMIGDYIYNNQHNILQFEKGKGRQVILSLAVQPDFETDTVVLPIVKLQEKALEGASLPSDFQPLYTAVNKDPTQFKERLEEYEAKLQKHLIYNLTEAHRLPALEEVQSKLLNRQQTIDYLKQLIKQSDLTIPDLFFNRKFKTTNGQSCDWVFSLEALFRVALEQLRNEFSVLEKLGKDYVYTIDPSRIFAQMFGQNNVPILNLLYILALKFLSKNSSFEHLKIIGFNDFADKEAISLLQEVFPDKQVCPKKDLFKEPGYYSVKEPYALVIHNNSDGFGQNIEFEVGHGSMDAVIGQYSDAFAAVKREREDLMQYLC